MRERAKGAAAGGGLGFVVMVIQLILSWLEASANAATEAASQAGYLELLKVMAEQCGG